MKRFIPRAQMPQIVPEDYVSLITAAHDAGIPVSIAPRDFRTLHAHQRVNHEKAINMPEIVRAIPIVISDDNGVLDGNHRWWARAHLLEHHGAVLNIGLPFEKALDWLSTLPFVTHAATYSQAV